MGFKKFRKKERIDDYGDNNGFFGKNAFSVYSKGTYVKVNGYRDLEPALKRLEKRVEKAGILSSHRRHFEFIKPSKIKRDNLRKAKVREGKRL